MLNHKLYQRFVFIPTAPIVFILNRPDLCRRLFSSFPTSFTPLDLDCLSPEQESYSLDNTGYPLVVFGTRIHVWHKKEGLDFYPNHFEEITPRLSFMVRLVPGESPVAGNPSDKGVIDIPIVEDLGNVLCDLENETINEVISSSHVLSFLSDAGYAPDDFVDCGFQQLMHHVATIARENGVIQFPA
jgi:hypothetical protein